MSLGGLFSFKSKAQVEKEQREYTFWAFPGGQPQRDRVEGLLKELFPKISLQFSMFNFLTCKELYEKILEDNENGDDSIDRLYRALQVKQKHAGLKSNDWFLFIALILADRAVKGGSDYPSAEEIKVSAGNLKSSFEVTQNKERKKRIK